MKCGRTAVNVIGIAWRRSHVRAEGQHTPQVDTSCSNLVQAGRGAIAFTAPREGPSVR